MNSEQLISNIIKNGVTNNEEREILGKSLFYYCSGKDPSPIIAFGSDYHLYIYSDIAEDLEDSTIVLYQRLQNTGYQLLDKKRILGIHRWNKTENIELTRWAAPNSQDFHVLYLQFDAESSFKNLFSDRGNYIQPRCICNYRYEFFRTNSDYFFNQIEKRTEYIFGYCFSKKYRLIDEYKYYGDYESETTIKLYRRMYWYVY